MLKGKKIEMMLLKREMILGYENKSDYIDQFEKNFQSTIKLFKHLTPVRIVDEKFKTYKSLFIETKDIVEETFDDVDVSKSEVKKLKDIRKMLKRLF